MKSPDTTVKMASGKPVNIQHQAKGNTELEENFLILPKMNHMLLVNLFFNHYKVDKSPDSTLLKLPDFSVE